MALTVAERREVWAGFMADLSRQAQPIALTKPELAAALAAADDWLDANAASFNAALPAAARVGLTPGQKAAVLAAVTRRRAGGA